MLLDELERRQRVALAGRSFFARDTPWRRPAVIGMATLSASIVGIGLLAIGLTMTQDAENRIAGEVIDPGKHAAGITLTAIGAPTYLIGLPTGITLLAIAGVRRKKARRAAAVALGSGGLRLAF